MPIRAEVHLDLTWDERLRLDLEIPDHYTRNVLWEAVQSLPTSLHDIVVMRYGIESESKTVTAHTMPDIAAKRNIRKQSIEQAMLRTKLQILQSLLQTEKGE